MSEYVFGKNSFFEALNNKRIIKAYVLNDKEIKPRKIDIKKSECMMYSSMVEATRRHTQYMPELLSDYHQNLKSEYQNRSMKDDELDRQVYFSHNTELIA